MNRSPLQMMTRHQSGVTLIESLITLAVATVVLGAAAPSFEASRERRQIEGVSAQLQTDIQHARGLSVARNKSVRMSFEATAAATCYVVHTGNAGDCQCSATAAPVCRGGAQALQSMRFGADTPVRVVSNSSSILFDAVHATVTPTATIKVQGRVGAIHEVINIMGRVRSCSPAPAVAGYKPC